jgi:hypothetical protein
VIVASTLGWFDFNIQNVNVLINYLLHLVFQPMHEYQLLSIPILAGDHNEHLLEVLDVGGQKTFVIPLGELQEFHSILKHQMVRHEPLI